MLRVIRKGVFETNSSSTHSITMCSKEDYDKWERGEMFYSDGGLVSKEEAIEELKNNKWFNKNKLKFFYHITPYSEIKLVSNTNQFLNVKVYEVDPPIYYQLMNQKILCAKVIEY